MDIQIDTIRIDGGTQARAELDAATAQEYAAVMLDGAQFPPVTVFYDGAYHWLADGFHRLEAARIAGRETIAADIHSGTQRDAVLYSVGANATHGLRRTNADKRQAVLMLLLDPEWAQWSDSEIARRCRVDHKTVAGLRASWEIPRCGERLVERGGVIYTQRDARRYPLSIAVKPATLAKWERHKARIGVADDTEAFIVLLDMYAQCVGA